jgi:hypothetical protein
MPRAAPVRSARRVAEWPTRRVRCATARRAIAARYPRIDLFEDIAADPADRERLAEIERLTNPRLRQEIGLISLVPPEERLQGPGASRVMAAFTHINPSGGRFKPPDFGAWDAAASLATAIRETVFHRGRMLRASKALPARLDMRVLRGPIDGRLLDFERAGEAARPLPDPDSYAASQALAREVRAAGGDGFLYPSVRDPSGRCVAALRPRVVGIPAQERHLQHRWDGTRIASLFDHAEQRSKKVEEL